MFTENSAEKFFGSYELPRSPYTNLTSMQLRFHGICIIVILYDKDGDWGTVLCQHRLLLPSSGPVCDLSTFLHKGLFMLQIRR